MVVKDCKVCGRPFDAKGRALTCKSGRCKQKYKQERKKLANAKYRSDPEVKKKRKAYQKNWIDKNIMSNPERKEAMYKQQREYRAREEVSEHRRIMRKKKKDKEE
mgnify:FL=1|tara:strand:- start:1974 stop:2288 length:315 start_codon:yes stop_codon:yes gene_type:complete